MDNNYPLDPHFSHQLLILQENLLLREGVTTPIVWWVVDFITSI